MSNEVIPLAKKYETLRDALEGMRGAIEKVLPPHMVAERFVRIALTACRANPKLFECTKDSILSAVMISAQLGLECDGVRGQAYLIPRCVKGTMTACWQPGYKGLRDLAYRSDRVRMVNAEIVYERDFFEIELGSEPRLIHKPPARGSRGQAVGAYAIVFLRDSIPLWKYMSKEELEAHRDQYCQRPKFGPWTWETDTDAMWLKTCSIKLFKWTPSSIEMERAIALDEESERGLNLGAKDITDSVQEIPTTVDTLESLTQRMNSRNAKVKDDDVPFEDTGEIVEPEEPSRKEPEPVQPELPTAPPKAKPAKETKESLIAKIEQEAKSVPVSVFDANMERLGFEPSRLDRGSMDQLRELLAALTSLH